MIINKTYKINTIHYIYLAYFILLLIIVFFPLDFLLVLLPDDSYYYFEIAKNVALTGESTFDTINKTNGFQPLWLILIIPFFSLKLDLVLTLRIIVLFSGFIFFITLIFIYRISRLLFDNKTAEFCVLLFAFNPLNLIINLNGTEAVINGLILSILFYYIFKTSFEDMNKQDYLIIGFLLSLSFLARTDNIIIISSVISFAIFSGMIKIKKENIKNLFLFFVALIILPLIYITWNLINFKHILPISGVAFGVSINLVL
ncbi:MAG: glycosyltransferase family 39 protein, partial [Candidatus Odinarchaeota archaeon]